ncbi:MAG TPA: TylF/MycF/NovP-related O-methyltransferase [Candidatus Elarobacter sp.]
MPHESIRISLSPEASLESRSRIHAMIDTFPGSLDERERSLGLFLRGSLLARIMATAEIYRSIVGLPGSIFDIGTWRGQTAVLCENFRAIYEPLNLTRRVVAFDTFSGYAGFGPEDRPTEIHRDGTYDVGGERYEDYLAELLRLHESSNVLGHIYGKHRLVRGDVRETLPAWLDEHRNEIVALAFLDVNAVEPTRASIEALWPRLVPGGKIAIWQLVQHRIPAEGIVYASEVLGRLPHRLSYAPTYPGLCIVEKTG